MSFFAENTDYNANDAAAASKDIVGGQGFKALPSDVYDFTVNHAYLGKSSGGATSVNLELEAEGHGKRSFTVYVTNKQGGIKYEDKKTNQMEYLPGFLLIDSLCLLACGKPLLDLVKVTEKRSLELWNKEAKQKMPTDVDMLMPLLKTKVKAAVELRIENKTKRNDQTGKYDPINEPRESNELIKFFRERDNMTVNEIRARLPEAKFMGEWLAVWQGKPNDKFKPVAAAGTFGAPGGSFAGAGGAGEPAGTTGDQGTGNMFM